MPDDRFVPDPHLLGTEKDKRGITDLRTGATLCTVWPVGEDFDAVAYPHRAPNRDRLAARLCDLLNASPDFNPET